MKSKRILFAVGTRPNIMKLAPLYHAFKENSDFELFMIHTGQHYDFEMSKVFFQDFSLPEPDFYLNVNRMERIKQFVLTMTESEKVLADLKPDLVIVFGDVDSTLAVSISAVKLKLTLAHVESGLRSFDRRMPEEINRILTDSIADYHFITEESALLNLKREGYNEDSIFFVGNTMIDSLVYVLSYIEKPAIETPYALLTLHRPQNVDDGEKLKEILLALKSVLSGIKVIFPIHPRTRKNIEIHNLNYLTAGFEVTQPKGYREFISLLKYATIVITDSGGIQEESTFLKVPCVTIRENTERPVTIEIGTNTLAGTKGEGIVKTISYVLKHPKKGFVPLLWDGMAAKRIVKIIKGLL